MIAARKNKCASSEVAIAGDALRRPSWHWQAVSMSTSDGSCNRLTLGSAPTRPENYTLVQISVNEFVCPEAINFSSSQDRTSISRKTATLRAFDRLWRGSYTANSSIANGQVAQLVERGPEKAGVGGSIPSLATILSNNLRDLKTV